jgi:U-box domain/Sel1 repeat
MPIDELSREVSLPAEVDVVTLQRYLEGLYKQNGRTSVKRHVRNGDSSDTDEAPSPKRPKTRIEDDLLCPITKELPFEPVTAEDGRLYEKQAIEEYFASHPEWDWLVRSPVTNQRIGKQLFPAPIMKSHIETLIEHGILTGDSAKLWKAKLQEKKEMEDLLKWAEQGHANSMLRIARRYKHGTLVIKADLSKAYAWYEKAHKKGSLRATAHLGEFLVKGLGVDRDERKGAMFLSIAAGKGSDCAAYEVGTALAEGIRGFPMDRDEAMYWLRMCISGKCRAKHLGNSAKERAKALLHQLQHADDPEKGNSPEKGNVPNQSES